MRTPWGQSDGQKQIIKGVTEVFTPRHGGIYLSPERVKQLPAFVTTEHNFLGSLAWWEEDCDWAIPFICFADEIGAKHPERASSINAAWQTVLSYHPALHERLVDHFLRNVTTVTPVTDDSELILANRDF